MTSRPSPSSCSKYTAFATIAILGWQDQADELIRQHQSDILRTAAYLRFRFPVPIKPLYRGLLLQAQEASTGRVIGRFQTQEYVSFSEDPDVACWFASPDSFITPDDRLGDPSWTGWVVEYTPNLDEILFHWSWHTLQSGQIGNLPGPTTYDIIQMNSPPQEVAWRIQQFYWNAKSQQEVSIAPPSSHLAIQSRDAFGCRPTTTLDKKLVFRPDFVMITPDVAKVLGVSPGKMPVIDIDYHSQKAVCQLCGQPGITTTYHLRDRGLLYQHCFVCHKVTWGVKP